MEKKKWRSDMQMYEWYKDTKGRIWVVVGFWYENEIRDKVYLLQMGYQSWITQPYDVVQNEIAEKRMQLISAKI